jgi:hypothetical protein
MRRKTLIVCAPFGGRLHGEGPYQHKQDADLAVLPTLPGAGRIARLVARTRVLIRLKSDIPLKRASEVLPDHSYLAELSGDGVTVTVRAIEYWPTVEGQAVPEMFCLVTDLLDWREYPRSISGGSKTGCGKPGRPCTAPIPGPCRFRSGSPALVRQELAAWAAAREMTCGAARDVALAAVPARKGRRAGQAVRLREISHARTRRAILAAIRSGRTCYQALTSRIGKFRNVADPNRHLARKSKSPSSFTPATEKYTVTASPRPSSPWPTTPPDQHRHRNYDQARHHPARGTGRHRRGTPTVSVPESSSYPASLKTGTTH